MVVVGASASIGRALALHAIRGGAEVVAAARRADRLEELVREAGGGTAIATDVCDPQSCESLMAVVAKVLGEIDVVCYTAGYTPLRLMADTSATDWQEILSTNVVGANQIIRAALPLLAPGAMVLALSSEAVGRPRSALGGYGSSKAALEESLKAWRVEQPGVRFCCAAIGPTVPTEFGDSFDPELLTWALKDWTARGLAQEEFMDTAELAEVMVETVAVLLERPGIGLEHMTLRSPSNVTADSRALSDPAQEVNRTSLPDTVVSRRQGSA
jgi:NAD(P)-dependent dehydrogenase (short-subunit alcohol dehydrogenase family)